MVKKNKPFFKVTCNTEHLGPGSTFVAIAGYKTDGALFIPKAIELGALKIIADETSLLAREYSRLFPHIPFSFVPNSRKELACESAAAYEYPAAKLKIIAVTGTKGKTTTIFLIHHCLQALGYKVALCSSIINKIEEEEEESMHATMGSDALHYFLARCVEKNITHVVLEVSSHALALYRVHGVPFIAAGFTNCTPEHLDFHEDFQDYFCTKKKLFDQVVSGGSMVINTNNYWGQELYRQLAHEKPNASLMPSDNSFSSIPSLWDDAPFMKENVDLALTLCISLGLNKNDLEKSLSSFEGVSGRLQFHTLKNGALGVVDHAHEPLSFETVLLFLKQKRKQLIVIFGCGGDRTYKRPLLGAIAAKHADIILLTNDNPRFDDPHEIMHDILAGIPEHKRSHIIIELNRARALERAILLSSSDSCIALLGKGHEKYQIEQGVTRYWNDYEALIKY